MFHHVIISQNIIYNLKDEIEYLLVYDKKEDRKQKAVTLVGT
jgi:hypothetical protein